MKRNDKLRFAGVLKDMVLTGPEKLVIHITDRCNFNCLYCYYHAPERKRKDKKDMDFNFFKKVVDEAGKLGIGVVSLSASGEPTLHPRIGDMIDYAKSKGMKLLMTTNGSFNKGMLKHILKIDTLIVSLSSVSEDRFKELQQDKYLGFHNVMENLLTISKIKNSKKISRPFVQMNYIINKMNYKDIEKIFELAKRLKIDMMNFRLMVPTEWNERLALSGQESLGLAAAINDMTGRGVVTGLPNNLDDIREIASDLEFQKTGHVYRNSTNKFRPKACYSGWYYMSIDINGDVIPCCQIPRIVLGNAKMNSLKGIWESVQYSKWRDEGKHRMHGNKFIECNYCHLRGVNNTVNNKLN